MEDKAKYFKFLENSRIGVMAEVIVDAIEHQLRFSIGDVDWDKVKGRLKAQLSDWMTDTKDVIDFYKENSKEVDSILNKDDVSSVTDAIKAVCLKAYESLLSDFIDKLKEL